jgi:hypothetical protein
MAGISGLGTNYNLPNYTGILYALTPSETPLFSAIGGLTGGGQSTSTQFEWQTYDLRTAAQPAVLEGATAPTAQGRARGNVSNVCQIHQEKVSVAYSKIAASGQKAGINNDAMNPVRNEVDWQVEQMLKQMVRDVEYSFINGTYQLPSDNTTGRKTRGLLSAITSTARDADDWLTPLPTVTATASTDVVNSTAHGLAAGDQVIFTALTGGTGLAVDTVYYVISSGLTANAFKLAATRGGSAIDITVDASAATAYKMTALTVDAFYDTLQSVYDNGGLSEQETNTVIVNSSGKRALSNAFADAYGKFNETSRNLAGVNVTTIESDFGRLNVMLDRFVPQHKLIVASLDQLIPVFLEVPEKGHFFAEPLAKTGASDDVQLYGEVGLAYGNEKAHGVLSGFAV